MEGGFYMQVKAITRNVRMSASKGRALGRKIQGMKVSDALRVVDFSPKKAAFHLGKTIKSALANARDKDEHLDVDSLRVVQAVFDEGPRMRRFWPRARGSASPILRRMCHVRVLLSNEK